MAIDLEKLQESPNLLDILLQMEDVLDQMDVYVFDNWLKGEVIEGPIVRRYWLDMTLRYDFKDMPDPRAALRLLKHGVRVDYEKARYSDEDPKADPEVIEDEDGDKEYKDEEMCWLLRVSIPRRLVVQIDAAQHDFYDEEIDIDDVEDAKDSGIDDESAYTDGEQAAPGGADPMGGDPMGGPGGPPPGGPGGPPPGKGGF